MRLFLLTTSLTYMYVRKVIMCVFCKVLLIPNFNFLRETYEDTLFGIKYKIQDPVFPQKSSPRKH